MANKQEHFLDQTLDSLKIRIMVMGAAVENAVGGMERALRRMDPNAARLVLEGDDAIDGFENEIDETALNILALHQPVACDLRFVVSALRIVVDMERVGDEAANVCNQVILLKGTPANEVTSLVGDHLTRSVTALADALSILRRGDAEQALAMRNSEDEAIQGEVRILQKLVDCRTGGMADGPLDPVFAMHMILVVHSLTRIWRRAVNIAGHVYFASLGDSIKHLPKLPKGDRIHF